MQRYALDWSELHIWPSIYILSNIINIITLFKNKYRVKFGIFIGFIELFKII